MRRFLARTLGALSLGALLAMGVGATAAAADSPATTSAVASTHGAKPMGSDWWT